jgi:hypothetical protein
VAETEFGKDDDPEVAEELATAESQTTAGANIIILSSWNWVAEVPSAVVKMLNPRPPVSLPVVYVVVTVCHVPVL